MTRNSSRLSNLSATLVSSRVSTKQSPYMKIFYKHHPLLVTLDTGAEINMIKHSVAQFIGATIHKSNQRALQADDVTHLTILDETHIMLSRSKSELTLKL